MHHRKRPLSACHWACSLGSPHPFVCADRKFALSCSAATPRPHLSGGPPPSTRSIAAAHPAIAAPIHRCADRPPRQPTAKSRKHMLSPGPILQDEKTTPEIPREFGLLSHPLLIFRPIVLLIANWAESTSLSANSLKPLLAASRLGAGAHMRIAVIWLVVPTHHRQPQKNRQHPTNQNPPLHGEPPDSSQPTITRQTPIVSVSSFLC